VLLIRNSWLNNIIIVLLCVFLTRTRTTTKALSISISSWKNSNHSITQSIGTFEWHGYSSPQSYLITKSYRSGKAVIQGINWTERSNHIYTQLENDGPRRPQHSLSVCHLRRHGRRLFESFPKHLANKRYGQVRPSIVSKPTALVAAVLLCFLFYFDRLVHKDDSLVTVQLSSNGIQFPHRFLITFSLPTPLWWDSCTACIERELSRKRVSFFCFGRAGHVSIRQFSAFMIIQVNLMNFMCLYLLLA